MGGVVLGVGGWGCAGGGGIIHASRMRENPGRAERMNEYKVHVGNGEWMGMRTEGESEFGGTHYNVKRPVVGGGCRDTPVSGSLCLCFARGFM